MISLLSVITNEQFWICFVTVVGGLLTIVITQLFQIYTIRLNAQIASDGRNTINKKLDENTELTKITQTNIETLAKYRMGLALGRKPSAHHDPEFFDLKLPGVDYEPFGLSTGALVEWKSEQCEKGRSVRFLVHGPASIGFHFHLCAEINFGVAGTLVYETEDRVVHIGPGESFTAQPDEIHRASFDGPGEALCRWPDLESNTLTIGFYPQQS